MVACKMNNLGDGENAHRERIWFNSTCLSKDLSQLTMF